MHAISVLRDRKSPFPMLTRTVLDIYETAGYKKYSHPYQSPRPKEAFNATIGVRVYYLTRPECGIARQHACFLPETKLMRPRSVSIMIRCANDIENGKGKF